MSNDTLLHRLFEVTTNAEYRVYIKERISPTIFYCRIFVNHRFIYGIDVYENTIINNIINGLWKDISNSESEGQ